MPFAIRLTALLATTILLPYTLHADSAIWQLAPATNDWNTAGNWSAGGVPNSDADVATFDFSVITDVSLAANTQVDSIVFNAGASAFTITAVQASKLGFSGAGITNNSSLAQNFVAAGGDGVGTGKVIFTNSATAGNNTFFNNNGGTVWGAGGGFTTFSDTSTAGNGTFINNGSAVQGPGGGFTTFSGTSTAGNGTFINNAGTSSENSGGTIFNYGANAGNGNFVNKGGTVSGASGGYTVFYDGSSASYGTFTTDGGTVDGASGGITIFHHSSDSGSGTFTTNGGTASGASGGITMFRESSHADSGTFTTNGGAVSGASGGITIFEENSHADGGIFISNGGTVDGASGGSTFLGNSLTGTSLLIANGGLGGGQGGQIVLSGYSLATVQIFGNGSLNVGGSETTIGSLEGTGNVFLKAPNLIVGSNDRSTIFSGVIQDSVDSNIPCSFTKTGDGTLTLSGVNTYTGTTTINGGTLVAAHNSALSTGIVIINAGTLLVQSDVTITNLVMLEGGNLAQDFRVGESLSNAIVATKDDGIMMQTASQILEGTASTDTTLQSSFTGYSPASNDAIRQSDVFSLSGVPVINVSDGETDTFVLQLHYSNMTADSFLGWLDPVTNRWVNAVDGNIGGTAFFVGDRAYNALFDFNLGTYGVNSLNNTVWAVLNHNSDFAIIPEPPTGVLFLGGTAVHFVFLLRRRTSSCHVIT